MKSFSSFVNQLNILKKLNNRSFFISLDPCYRNHNRHALSNYVATSIIYVPPPMVPSSIPHLWYNGTNQETGLPKGATTHSSPLVPPYPSYDILTSSNICWCYPLILTSTSKNLTVPGTVICGDFKTFRLQYQWLQFHFVVFVSPSWDLYSCVCPIWRNLIPPTDHWAYLFSPLPPFQSI